MSARGPVKGSRIADAPGSVRSDGCLPAPSEVGTFDPD